VRDTPISEAAIVGMAVGAALSGLKPIVEISFIDFMTFAMDAMVNQAAKMRTMFGGQVGADGAAYPAWRGRWLRAAAFAVP
jgi:pyruvate/2-oxoglutarate/acetoin dehydrogenase E1 component